MRQIARERGLCYSKQSMEDTALQAADMAKTDILDESDEPRLYEAGFHIVPMVGEEGLAAEVENVRSIIERAGGRITGEEYPRSMALAYPMQAVIERRRHTCASA